MDKAKVADYYGVDLEAVIRCGLVDEGGKTVVRALVNYGIGGIKVHLIDPALLEGAAQTDVADEPPLVPAAIDLGLENPLADLTVADLRELAKEAGISYSGKRKAELIADLEEE